MLYNVIVETIYSELLKKIGFHSVSNRGIVPIKYTDYFPKNTGSW